MIDITSTRLRNTELDFATIERRRNALRDSILKTPYIQSLGMEMEAFEVDGARIRLPFHAIKTNDGKRIHGGVIGAALDTVAACAFWANFSYAEVVSASTVSMTIHYLRPCEGDLICSASVLRTTRHLAFIEAKGVNSAGELVAHGTMTFNVSSRSAAKNAVSNGHVPIHRGKEL
jgi:uncharacterized protein (TIGR00369 family)